MTTYFTPSSSNARPWDDGIMWYLQQETAPDLENSDPLTLEFVRDHHLKLASGELENDYVNWLIRTSYRRQRTVSNRAGVPETWRLVMSAAPWGDIVVPVAPLLSVDSIAYVGSDGTDGELAGSPAEYEAEIPSGPKAGKGRIRTLANAAWPSTADQDGAFVVTFTSGYAIGDDGKASIPEEMTDGRLLWIAERYKQRSLTDNAFNQNKAAIQARQLWMDYRVY